MRRCGVRLAKPPKSQIPLDFTEDLKNEKCGGLLQMWRII
jgi:hypothetical protein